MNYNLGWIKTCQVLSWVIVFLTCLSPVAAYTPPLEENEIQVCGVIDWLSDNRRIAANLAANLDVGEPRTVRMIYFLPRDRRFHAEVVQKMKHEIIRIQAFFAEQMGAHGHGKLTFRVETDLQGDPMVHRADGQHPDWRYRDDTWQTVYDEIEQAFDPYTNVYLVVVDNSIDAIGRDGKRFGGTGGRRGKSGGLAMVSGGFHGTTAAHELGHAFGLKHDFQDGTYIMSYGPRKQRHTLSACNATFLAMHPYLNRQIPIEEGTAPSITLISPGSYPIGAPSVRVQLKVSDSEGLDHALLFVETREPHGAAGFLEVKACRGLTGEKEGVLHFDYDGVVPSDQSTNLSNPTTHPIEVWAIDVEGNWNLIQDNLLRDSPLTIISGNNQIGFPNVPLSLPFVIEYRDPNDGSTRAGILVTFGVTAGGGMLSAAAAFTDFSGRAESTLTLGPNLGTNTAEVSAGGFKTSFNAKARPPVNIPNSNLRTAIEQILGKQPGELIAPDDMETLTTNERGTWSVGISDLTGLEFAVNLTHLDLSNNLISDISPLAGLTKLKTLDLSGNSLSYPSIYVHIAALQARGVQIDFDNRIPTTLLIVSGNNQRELTGAALSDPLVVEARDQNGLAFEGVPFDFVVTEGDGFITTRQTETDINGRAEARLTLGQLPEKNTVQVTAEAVRRPVLFHAYALTEPHTLLKINGDNQSAPPGTKLPIPLIVQVRDKRDKPMEGLWVEFTVTGGGGALTVTRQITNRWGSAKSELRLGENLAKNTIEVKVAYEDLWNLSVVFHAEGVPPTETALLPNFPNPFTSGTYLPYQLAEDETVAFTIHDAAGRILRRINLGNKSAGYYIDSTKAAFWDGRNELGEMVASGSYYCWLGTPSVQKSRRLVVLRR